MKHSLLFIGAMLLSTAYSQTTIFQDNFESGAGNWTLNGGTGLNEWIVNSDYVDASGLNLVPDTPNQPVGVTNGTNSAYLHIYNSQACNLLNICNASFETTSTSNQSATQMNAVSTTGYTAVTLQFIYLCAGASGTTYGLVEYSTNGGSSWTAASSNYTGVTTWTNASIALPAFNNVASLKFRFRWQNGNTGNDPAFAVDEVKIIGTPASSTSVATGTIPSTTYCNNISTAISVPFNVTGTVNAGNIFTAQLSSSTGSFAAPTAIGTLSSTSTGSLTINANIPAGLAVGNAYRIRVVASNPVTVGADNGTNITMAAPPTVSVSSLPANGHICPGNSASLIATGGAVFVWSPAGSLDNANNQNVVATPSQTTVYTVVGTDANGCSNSSTFTVTVDPCLGIAENETIAWSIAPNPVADVLSFVVDPTLVISQVEVLDVTGKLIYSATSTAPISTQTWSEGTYLVRLYTNQGLATKQLVKL